MTRPPRFFESLLRKALPPGPDWESILGDLREDFDRQTKLRGSHRARRWYRRQATRLALEYGRTRITRSLAGRRPMKSLALVVRGLLRAPVFTATAVMALGLGIGASTAVFSVADGTIFRPLPYADPDRLIAVRSTIRARNMLSWDVPFAEYEAWREASQHLSGLAGFAFAREYTLDVAGELGELRAVAVTPGFVSTLGVPPTLGRDLGAADFEPGAPRTMLILDDAWRRVFHSDADAVGRVVSLNGTPTTIVGVLPASFAFPTASTWGLADGVVPYDVAAAPGRRFQLVGRLADGSTADDVVAELDPLAASRATDSGLRDTPIDGASA
ncbi:MAG TPA: ABC transporter permease, partial [Vicinamibacterales bacterium]|nr:ABC transporter permease [Vicinamibacterales bacterium]